MHLLRFNRGSTAFRCLTVPSTSEGPTWLVRCALGSSSPSNHSYFTLANKPVIYLCQVLFKQYKIFIYGDHGIHLPFPFRE
jgi:hypothetical protein